MLGKSQHSRPVVVARGPGRRLAGVCRSFWPGLLAAPRGGGLGPADHGQLGFQEAVTPIAEQIHRLHDFVNIIIFAITAFVLPSCCG